MVGINPAKIGRYSTHKKKPKPKVKISNALLAIPLKIKFDQAFLLVKSKILMRKLQLKKNEPCEISEGFGCRNTAQGK